MKLLSVKSANYCTASCQHPYTAALMCAAQDDNRRRRSHVIGYNWDKLFLKKNGHHMTLTAAFHSHCFQTLTSHFHPPPPCTVPTGEEALSLIKEAVATK